MNQVSELVPLTIAANIPQPPTGYVNQFYDTADGNKLKVKNSDGTVTGIFAGATAVKIAST